MGLAFSRHITVRPIFLREMSPASDSTLRCFKIAGSDIEKGSASSLTDKPVDSDSSLANSARRVASERAPKVRSSAGFKYLTIKLSFGAPE